MSEINVDQPADVQGSANKDEQRALRRALFGRIGSLPDSYEIGVVAAATINTLTLAGPDFMINGAPYGGAPTTDGACVSDTFTIISGPGSGEAAKICISYVGATRTATLSSNWTTIPVFGVSVYRRNAAMWTHLNRPVRIGVNGAEAGGELDLGGDIIGGMRNKWTPQVISSINIDMTAFTMSLNPDYPNGLAALGRCIPVNSNVERTLTFNPAALGEGWNCYIFQQGTAAVRLLQTGAVAPRNEFGHTRTRGQNAPPLVVLVHEFTPGTPEVMIGGATKA